VSLYAPPDHLAAIRLEKGRKGRKGPISKRDGKEERGDEKGEEGNFPPK